MEEVEEGGVGFARLVGVQSVIFASHRLSKVAAVLSKAWERGASFMMTCLEVEQFS